MAEENLNQEIQTPELTPVEQKAAEQGWVPKDQWQGDPDDWRPAKEFVDRGELLHKISEGNREIKALKQAMEHFGQHHARVREMEFQRALAVLKAQKKEAIEAGDGDAVVELDERIDAAKEEMRAVKETPVIREEPQVDPAFVSWLDRNRWYASDRAMKAVADEVGRSLAAAGETDRKFILAEVEKTVKKEFPHKFTNPAREKASAVEGSTNKGSTKNSDPTAGMSEVEKRMMRKIVSTVPGMTEEKYLQEYNGYKGRGR